MQWWEKEVTTKGYQVDFWSEEIIWNHAIAMVATVCDYIKTMDLHILRVTAPVRGFYIHKKNCNLKKKHIQQYLDNIQGI